MSTKALRRALDILEAHGKLDGSKDAVDAAAAARDELKAIERAAKVVALQGIFEHPDDDADCLSGIHSAEGVFESIAKDAP